MREQLRLVYLDLVHYRGTIGLIAAVWLLQSMIERG